MTSQSLHHQTTQASPSIKREQRMYYSQEQGTEQWSAVNTAGTGAPPKSAAADHGASSKQSDSSMVSPTSAGSFDEEMQQRKLVPRKKGTFAI